MTTTILVAILAAALGAAFAWLAVRGAAAALRQRAETSEAQAKVLEVDVRRFGDLNTQFSAEKARLEATLELERTAAEEKLALLNDAQKKLSDAFQALSGAALKSNNEAFLQLAKARLETFQQQATGDLDARRTAIENLLKPVNESLAKVNSELRELEGKRETAYATLHEQVRSLGETQQQLQAETGNLVKALREPQVRGRWGEIQLKRCVEFAGMVEYCDFVEQEEVATEDGRWRPDMIVRLPGGKRIVVDSKTPLKAYLDACQAADPVVAQQKLAEHAAQVRDHLQKLAAKKYWQQFDDAPDFVVMFLPGEVFFSAALEHDPELIEAGANCRVILASPTTLIALLRAVAYGWQQEQISRTAAKIAALGADLYERVRTMAEHFDDVGKGLSKAVESYSRTVATLESRVLVTARKFPELNGALTAEVPELKQVEKVPRELQAGDWVRKGAASGE